MDCVTVGKGIRLLVPRDLESSLLGASIYTKKDQGWTLSAKANGLLFDFSRVEYADFGAVVQVVLLIESALRSGIDVTLAMPFPEPRKGELRWIKENPKFGGAVAWRVNRRKRCKSFLAHLRLREALDAPHISGLPGHFHIVDDFDPATTGKEVTEEDFGEPGELAGEALDVYQEHEPARYHYFLPLTWLSTTAQDPWLRIGAFLVGVIGQNERGIEGPDANAIANVVLSELVENVEDHAETTNWALLGAWARPETSQPRPEYFLDAEQGFLEWFVQQPSSMVELVLGDSGVGIPASLRESYLRSHRIYTEALMRSTRYEQEIMDWAFYRWSSKMGLGVRKVEGTRGLYRVDRVVTRYQGIITIRAENHLVGLDHGGSSYNQPVFAKGQLSRVPGTILRLRLPASRISSCPREPGRRLPPDVHFCMVDMGELQQTGFSEIALQRLHKSLEEIPSGENSCVLARVHGSQVSPGLLHDAVLQALSQAIRRRHPPALILFGLPGGWSLIENAVDSVNKVHEEQRRDVESPVEQDLSVWDPVLVVGTRGESAWVGASVATRQVLALMNSDRALSREDIKSLGLDEKTNLEMERLLRGDTALFSYGIDGKVSLRVQPGHIPRIIGQLLEANIQSTSEGDINKGKAYLTPSLHLVWRWLNIDRILSSTLGPQVVITALYMKLSSVLRWKPIELPNVVVTDSTNYVADVALLQECIGIAPNNRGILPLEAAAPVPAGVRLFKEGSRVLIYNDIISTGETVQRCARQALRDGAKVLAISCLFDARAKKGVGMVVWGLEIPVVSLAHVDMLLEEGTPQEYINPVSLEPERGDLQEWEGSYRINGNELNQLLQNNNALYFSHVGRPIGRHFTFYLGTPKLADEPIIQREFRTAIDEWAPPSSPTDPAAAVDGLDLCIPQSDPGSVAASMIAVHLLEHLRETRKGISRLLTLYRRPAYGQWTFSDRDVRFKDRVVIIDTGALTGTTITQMIRLAAERGAQRILVYVFLSQLPKDEERFLTMLTRLSVKVPASPQQDQQDQQELPFPTAEIAKPQKRIETVVREVEVSVKFLARYPIDAYVAADCPVCQQLTRLSHEMYPTEMLSEFARNQQRERLVVRSLESILAKSPEDFDGRPIHSQALLWMSSFRNQIVAAITSTHKRQALDELLTSLRSNVLRRVDPGNRESLWLLQFLAVESQWLRKPPLYLWILRQKVAEIALEVALDIDVDEYDRINAVVVLRTCSKALFASRFADLFDRAKKQRGVLDHLLYDAFTYITRPYHQSPEIFQPIAQSLRKVVKICEDHSLLGTPILDTTRRLDARAQAELAKSRFSGSKPSKAWSELLLIFGESYKLHDPVPKSMFRVLPQRPEEARMRKLVEARERDVPEGVPPYLDRWIRRLDGNWVRCEKFLDHVVMPCLVHLRRALLGEDARRTLGPDTVDRLVFFIDQSTQHSIPIAESDFSTLIRRLSRAPEDSLSRRTWEEFAHSARWFWEKIFMAPDDQSQESGRMSQESALIGFLKTAPAPLLATFDDTYQETKDTLTVKHFIHKPSVGRKDWAVFCPRDLLSDTYRELLENINQHGNGPLASTNIQLSVSENQGRIVLRLENDNCALSKTHGIGLKRLSERLRAFDVALDLPPAPREIGQQFCISISFDSME